MLVTAVCQASSSPVNESEAIVMITLSATSSLMCVELFEIHFNGKNKTVPVDSPAANFTVPVNLPVTDFTISNEELEPFLKGEVYFLDFEKNRSEVPCFFRIPGEFHFNNKH